MSIISNLSNQVVLINRTARAMRAALKRLAEPGIYLGWLRGGEDYEIYAEKDGEVIAIFDLRDCYRKRRPLKGIGKKLAKMTRTGK